MKTYIHALILTAALLLPACKPAPPANAVHEDGMVLTHEPLAIYPDAAYVELYYGKDSQETDDGFKPPADAKPVRLTPAQRQTLERAFSHIRVYAYDSESVEGVASCFDPHHFFRYYDKSGKQIGEIQVCFCCGQASFSPRLKEDKSFNDYVRQDIPAIEALVKSMDIPTDDYCQ